MKTGLRPHERLAEILRDKIRLGDWQPGSMIPARRRLAEEHGVALTTVERAVGSLISEGLLRADDRRGTFVAARDKQPDTGKPRESQGPLKGTVGIIAAIVPYQEPAFYEEQWNAQVLRGCEHGLASEPGLTTRFLNPVRMGQTPLTVEEVTGDLIETASAMILVNENPSPFLTSACRKRGIPLVHVSFDPLSTTLAQVFIDGQAGGAAAARHLLERGYTSLMYFRPFVAGWVEQRLDGVRQELEISGKVPQLLRVQPSAAEDLAVPAEEQSRLALQAARHILAGKFDRGTGVIAPNDMAAEGFLRAAREIGLEAGRDYGLVGFDDRARHLEITSLRPPLSALGEEAARLVLGTLRGNDMPLRVVLQPRLIVRSSSLPWSG